MIAVSDFINSYDYLITTSSKIENFSYAICQDFSDSSYWQNISLLPPFPITIYNSSEIYLNDECIGYYFKYDIDKDNKSVSYNFKLYDKNLLPENFDFHFEENEILNKLIKFATSGVGSFYNKKMIIDPK